MAMVKKSILKIAESYISKVSDNLLIREAYIFGSYSKGIETESSDIDIAIIFDNIENIFELQMQLMKLRREVDIRIEPHPFTKFEFNSGNPLANEILKTGIEINIPEVLLR